MGLSLPVGGGRRTYACHDPGRLVEAPTAAYANPVTLGTPRRRRHATGLLAGCRRGILVSRLAALALPAKAAAE